jgi:hypothetical protein
MAAESGLLTVVIGPITVTTPVYGGEATFSQQR